MDLLAQMANFIRIVEGQSLSSAARAQRISLPAVSRQLQALEAELGTTLVVRSTRKLRITDAGQTWYEHCVRVLRDVEEAKESVRNAKELTGRLVVSASVTFGAIILVPVVTKLTEKHPRFAVDLRLEDHLVNLVSEGVDVAIRAGSPPPDSTSFVAQPVFDMYRIVVAAPKWLRKHGTPRTPEQLAEHVCLVQVTPAGAPIRWHLVRSGEERTLEPRGQLRTNAPSALRDMALAGLGPAYLPSWLVDADIEAGRLRRVLPEWSSPSIMASAIYRAELRGSPRIRAFLEALPSELPIR
ncbi:Transcriptional regulator, LysR family [Labilithrix luteola]|uniref:Transcriptional regulator, LysR family n=1 Tax=Labilithrix luteola TaxID=1391654 RepID=A0A0K1PXL6_9BACT|nr:LysR family transcriptional regulator [Labilithrix luteola]AKU98247.1 Transcriptional regulator, LysR family [Labilithrix luteola]